MTREEIRALLIDLRDTIIREREYAIGLDHQAMTAETNKKEALLGILQDVKELHPDDRPLADQIRHENRRNAFLFRFTLNWIQETMEFFGRKATPSFYGNAGRTVSAPVQGRLLSGKI